MHLADRKQDRELIKLTGRIDLQGQSVVPPYIICC